jgi:tetratricopeptide (TPR) repeat protein
LQAPQWDEAIRYYTAAVALRPENVMAHNNLGIALWQKGRLDEAIAECREAVRLKKDYAEAHCNLGSALADKGRLDEAIAEYRVAIRLEKDYALAHNNLGFTLYRKGQLEEAVSALKDAIRLDKTFVLAHNNLVNALVQQGDLAGASATLQNLGNALRDKGDFSGAGDAFQRAIALKPEQAIDHVTLGNARFDSGDLLGARTAYQKAITLKPDLANAHYGLGNALRDIGDLAGAGAAFEKAIAIEPGFAEAHCNLGHVLRRKGEFRQALKELRCGHELGSKNPAWRYPSAQWVQQCERLVDLDGRLPDYLEGKAPPASPTERIELAGICSLRRLHRAAARFYEDAFAAQPGLANSLGAGHRYNAACAAALAGCGEGEDAKSLGDKEGARLRRQALDWLQADLAAWRRLLEKEPAKAGPAVRQQMQHWQDDADFVGVRGVEALGRLPAAERPDWQKLWQEVQELRQRAAATARPDKIDKKATPK